VLALATARALGLDQRAAMPLAAAIELIHTYSLIHDDLPAMDDDDLRRGKPTAHRAYGEATAILAGDCLHALAFEVLADPATHPDPAVRAELIADLARASGPAGMAGGQALDLEAERRALDEPAIRRMQAMKTGALIAFAAESGAILAGAPDEDRARLRRFGEIVGLAFQLADDLLDETADAATLGKATAKDAARGKKTLPALHGQDWTRRELERLVTQAEALLAPYGDKAETLKAAARFVAFRDR